MATEREIALPCPACRARLTPGTARIGNRRNSCKLCNRFVQKVRRVVHKQLQEQFEDEYKKLTARVELDVYPQVVEEWLDARGE